MRLKSSLRSLRACKKSKGIKLYIVYIYPRSDNNSIHSQRKLHFLSPKALLFFSYSVNFYCLSPCLLIRKFSLFIYRMLERPKLVRKWLKIYLKMRRRINRKKAAAWAFLAFIGITIYCLYEWKVICSNGPIYNAIGMKNPRAKRAIFFSNFWNFARFARFVFLSLLFDMFLFL